MPGERASPRACEARSACDGPGDGPSDGPGDGPGECSVASLALHAVMTTIGLIGSGHIGGTVARLALDAGHEVVLSNSRGPETLQDLAHELGPRARAATAEE